MKIGVFDSGLGGLFVLRSIRKVLPQYDYVYLGDTARVPYGNRSQAEIYRFTQQGVAYLFQKGCALVILACNTASARALRKIQREYLPKRYPKRRVLGVIIPTVESALQRNPKAVGIVATQSTVDSNAYVKEFFKRRKHLRVMQQAAPQLVPLIESDQLLEAKRMVPAYVQTLVRSRPDNVILGCTHYGMLRSTFRKDIPATTKILVQNDIVPKKLKGYLQRHGEISHLLSCDRSVAVHLTKISPHVRAHAWKWLGKHVRLRTARLGK